MEAFRDALDACQLMDVGFSSVWFTWERGNLAATNIRERLDREPTYMKNFRLIILCNVLYKIIAKVVANRFQNIIGVCIDKAQSTFFPGRFITDNVLVAYEILHTLKEKRTGKKGHMAFKLDMSKAYDRVEWEFLKVMMERMGFANSWVSFILKCIFMVFYSILLNGTKKDCFRPMRGLKPRNPLSPYLFLICSEGLSSLMRSAMKKGDIKGLKACRRGPQISHLLFVDDCIIFGEATTLGACKIKDVLKEYEKCSGQCVNFEKSMVFFSTNTSKDDRFMVARLLGVCRSNDFEKYLGLPNLVRKKKKYSFQNLKDRIKK
ncbi:hypothetical protein PVK06_047171 [Gossypium arboreum]|uniref:Reverse transcriptase domain-containing protein n=1 Tax=Gossypium arboreum TaxID=29729 RepID=A0ABR0MEH8_GOSAR|nr:hypothetical protein PVK06_047171 [Gossypium arboreum]